ncbi:hypothetical protein QR680_005156 [Steinernema hermaphroditum]|uniref:Nudix hydrolase domain-containing protein n=1 Tax=Steinernema hermaphroditum TaxID=289476 RepID=A0AA39LUV0_9BILA|nr:hypothetical protein QR680_005156 [Steinernema hermaphroditum]
MALPGTIDIFGGITVDSSKVPYGNGDVKAAGKALEESLAKWKSDGVRGVWFHVSNSSCFWIQLLLNAGFDFHHAQPGYAMLTKWLPDTKSTLPRYPFTTIGVGGLVVNHDGKILLMKERRGPYLGWKFPGGANDPNESIYETAEREVLEETGIEAKATSILSFRHGSRGFKDNMDIYFVCVMHPVDESRIEPKPCPQETAECKWISRDEINAMEWSGGFPILPVLEKYDQLRTLAPGRGCHGQTYSAGSRSFQVYHVN